ncbi:hypothetical protein F511_07767 [Dorcoceras hygrometricum]|uniref:Acyl-CoA dehydrogenase-related protein n=1 Tax=Dorcoceras hygrometricum TaxID=472368 RepID=A0A2Z7CUS9_9LAMI|nr:hypothetical protein F511_07767 [Dorcoceras hygrometricum]
MSLFDLQDVCIAIGSIATLDLPMVVDLIGIYGLKGPYCTLTTTNWFLQALSVIPRGSWGDVSRRSYHDPLGSIGLRPPSSLQASAAAARLRRKIVSGQFDEENPFVLISSVLLVQADEGVSFLAVDRIGDIYRNLPRRADVIVTTVGARHKCQQDQNSMRTTATPPPQAAAPLPPAARACVRDNHARWPRMATRRWRCVTVQEAQSLHTVRPRVAATLARSSCVDGRTMSAVARAGRAPAAREAAESCWSSALDVAHAGRRVSVPCDVGRGDARRSKHAGRASAT